MVSTEQEKKTTKNSKYFTGKNNIKLIKFVLSHLRRIFTYSTASFDLKQIDFIS